MKLLFAIMLLLTTDLAIAEDVTSLAPVRGWWCYAKSQSSAAKVLKWGCTLEDSKNASRKACNDQYGNCEVIHCYEDNPYKYSCIAGKSQNETTYGGFRAYSDSESLARSVALRNCAARWGSHNCSSLCSPNFVPPTDALQEKMRIQSETTLPNN